VKVRQASSVVVSLGKALKGIASIFIWVFRLVVTGDSFYPQPKMPLRCSGAGTIFGQRGEGQNRERQIDGIFIEFEPRFCPRNKRTLKKGLRQIWSAFLSQNKHSL